MSRQVATHALKTWPEFFEAILAKRKTFEVRPGDRDFREGDILQLREWDPQAQEYTGQMCLRRVVYVCDLNAVLQRPYVGMSILPIREDEDTSA